MPMRCGTTLVVFPGLLALALCAPAQAQDQQDLAKKLANPISSLTSVPLQGNYDTGIGPDGEGEQFVLNVQPVFPISLNPEWNLITRIILPIVSQDEIFPGAGDQSGLGDTTISLFLSPEAPAFGKLTCGGSYRAVANRDG